MLRIRRSAGLARGLWAERVGSSGRGLRTVVVPSDDRRIAFIDGVRTVFAPSQGVLKGYSTFDLGRKAIKGLMDRNPALDGKARPGEAENAVDSVCFGTVIQEVKTSNLGRESALGAGLSDAIPATTVTAACISSFISTMEVGAQIRTGAADVCIAGGAESMSDVPIRFSREIRKRMLASTKMKTPQQYLGLLRGLSLGHLAPELPAVAEFTSGMTMLQASEQLSAEFGVTRQEADEMAARSHQKAHAAHEAGHLADQIIPENGSSQDTGVRGDTTAEGLGKLRAASVKPHGTHTAGNSSFLTDGASANLYMSESKAKALGIKPRAYIKAWVHVAQDPFRQLLLSPAIAVPRLLKDAGLAMEDVKVHEWHEAFAAAVLFQMRAMESEAFTKAAGLPGPLKAPPMEQVNALGGAVAIGHPFAASAARQIRTAVDRLHLEDQQFAIATACAAGGQGVAMLIERA